MNTKRLVESIKRHEDLSLKPAPDPDGVTHVIGYGRNLERTGITMSESEYLLLNDVERCYKSATRLIERFDLLSDQRQGVLIEMVYQLGEGGVFGFRKMIEAVEAGDYEKAAAEMLDSKWAQQTPARAQELAKVMHSGEWPA